MRRAVIDIGTNTVKLLVADVTERVVTPVFTAVRTTRLGEGLQHRGHLTAAAITRTVAAVEEFVAVATRQGAPTVRALTTSAARSAANGAEFLAAVQRQGRVTVEVLSGQREAELIFAGITSDPAWNNRPLLGLDVGGGSAEWMQGVNGNLEHWRSLPLGSVRLTETWGDNFASVAGQLRRELPTALRDFRATGRSVVATGGGITTLARMTHNQVDHVTFRLEELRAWGERLSAMPLADRKKVPGLPPERADIIVAATAIYVVTLEIVDAPSLTVSSRSLRYGAVLEPH